MVNKTLFSDLKSVSDIVDLMIRGLEKEWVKVDMYTFGTAKPKKFLGFTYKHKCFGCAVTNALCDMIGRPFHAKELNNRQTRVSAAASLLNTGIYEIDAFENAINALRGAYVDDFLYFLRCMKSSFNFEIPKELERGIHYTARLRKLTTDNYKENLHLYKEFSRDLRTTGN